MTRTIAFASALCLGLMLSAAQASAAGRAPPADEQAADRYAAGAASEPAAGGFPQSAPVSAADADLVAFQQCRTSCAPQCDKVGDMGQSEHCQQACEMSCNVTGGK